MFLKADMTDANLRGSDLSKANFEGAQLIGTRIINSTFRAAKFPGSGYDRCNFK